MTVAPGWNITFLRDSAILEGNGYATWGSTHDLSTPHLLRLLRRRFRPPPGLGHETEYGLGFSFPAADITDVLALLSSFRHQDAYQDYTVREVPDSGAWSPPHIRQDQIRIYGPVLAIGSREPWAPTASVELEYATVADLLSNLRTVADLAHLDARADQETRRPARQCRQDDHGWLQEQTRVARDRYVAARRAFDTSTAESRRLLDLGTRRRSEVHDVRGPDFVTELGSHRRQRDPRNVETSQRKHLDSPDDRGDHDHRP